MILVRVVGLCFSSVKVFKIALTFVFYLAIVAVFNVVDSNGKKIIDQEIISNIQKVQVLYIIEVSSNLGMNYG